MGWLGAPHPRTAARWPRTGPAEATLSQPLVAPRFSDSENLLPARAFCWLGFLLSSCFKGLFFPSLHKIDVLAHQAAVCLQVEKCTRGALGLLVCLEERRERRPSSIKRQKTHPELPLLTHCPPQECAVGRDSGVADAPSPAPDLPPDHRPAAPQHPSDGPVSWLSSATATDRGQ